MPFEWLFVVVVGCRRRKLLCWLSWMVVSLLCLVVDVD